MAQKERVRRRDGAIKLIIQIPCYNETKTLEMALNDLPKHIDGIDEIEYLIVNDGSTDNTVQVAADWGAHHIVSFTHNKGLAKEVMACLEECIGGGLDEDRNWHQKKGGFFLPGKAMAALFKGKFLSGLKALHEAGNLSYEGEATRYRNQYEYQELPDTCYRKNWGTDIREPFAGAETIMHYLGRYTYRIAIGNGRILCMDGDAVTIKVKNYRSGDKWKELTLDGATFVRRFLMHVRKGLSGYGIMGS